MTKKEVLRYAVNTAEEVALSEWGDVDVIEAIRQSFYADYPRATLEDKLVLNEFLDGLDKVMLDAILTECGAMRKKLEKGDDNA